MSDEARKKKGDITFDAKSNALPRSDQAMVKTREKPITAGLSIVLK